MQQLHTLAGTSSGVVARGRRECSVFQNYSLLIADRSVGRAKADVNGKVRALSARIVRGLVDNVARLDSIGLSWCL